MASRGVRTANRHGPAYRQIVVALATDHGSEEGIALAAELASEDRAAITAVVVIELPAELPLEAHMLEEEAQARKALELARAIAARHGVRLRARVVRARDAGEAVVAEAEALGADLIVARAPRNHRFGGRERPFGKTVAYILKHAACRVLVTSPSQGA